MGEVARGRAVVVGGGVGGLAAAVGLQKRGWDVTVLERRSSTRGGSGISLWPNGLRALAALGLRGELLDGAVVGGHSAVRTPKGRYVARSDIGDAIRARYGLPLIVTHRENLLAALYDQLTPGVVINDVTACSIRAEQGGGATVVDATGAEYEADLIVIADGMHSRLRATLFPAHAGLRYAGYTSWRMVVDQPTDGVRPTETWGRAGQRFAVLPMGDGRVYCYATANARAGEQAEDERAELHRRFGHWHPPIPQIIDEVESSAVIRTDIFDIGEPLPVLHRGPAVLVGDAAHPMTPDLGQGGSQAAEDAVTLAMLLNSSSSIAAALAAYSAARARRAADLIRRSRRSGRLYQSPPAIARSAARLTSLLPAGILLRALDPVLEWQPPGAIDAESQRRRAPPARNHGPHVYPPAFAGLNGRA